VEAGCPVGDRAYSSEGLRDRGIDAGGGLAELGTEKENENENEERERSWAEEWPTEYTEYTERGTEFLTTKHTKVGGRGPECLPANYAKGREWGKRESEEWPTEYTEGGRDPEAEGGKLA